MKLTVEEYFKFRKDVLGKLDMKRYQLDLNEKLLHRILPESISQKEIEDNSTIDVPLQDMLQLYNAL